MFAALGDEQRLALVRRLGGGAASLTQLCEGRSITRQAITKHLHVLKDAGLVHGQRRGRESVWTLRPARVDQARKALDVIAKEWESALGRLKAFVEE